MTARLREAEERRKKATRKSTKRAVRELRELKPRPVPSPSPEDLHAARAAAEAMRLEIQDGVRELSYAVVSALSGRRHHDPGPSPGQTVVEGPRSSQEATWSQQLARFVRPFAVPKRDLQGVKALLDRDADLIAQSVVHAAWPHTPDGRRARERGIDQTARELLRTPQATTEQTGIGR